MRQLHVGRLRLGEVQLVLKMLVHHVNHAVADSPEEEQRGHEGEGDDHVLAVGQLEHAGFGGLIGVAHAVDGIRVSLEKCAGESRCNFLFGYEQMSDRPHPQKLLYSALAGENGIVV